MYKYKEGDAMDNMEMVEAMQDMFITYLKPIQEKIEILGLQNKVIQNKLDNMDLRLASLEYQVKNGFNRMDQDMLWKQKIYYRKLIDFLFYLIKYVLK